MPGARALDAAAETRNVTTMTAHHDFRFFAVTFALALALGCTQATATTNPGPDLCSLDGGRWCVQCSGSTCEPGEDSGWLCCAGGACVAVQLSGECTNGTVGWCSDYYEKTTCDPSGGACVTVAVCEDH